MEEFCAKTQFDYARQDMENTERRHQKTFRHFKIVNATIQEVIVDGASASDEERVSDSTSPPELPLRKDWISHEPTDETLPTEQMLLNTLAMKNREAFSTKRKTQEMSQDLKLVLVCIKELECENTKPRMIAEALKQIEAYKKKVIEEDIEDPIYDYFFPESRRNAILKGGVEDPNSAFFCACTDEKKTKIARRDDERN